MERFKTHIGLAGSQRAHLEGEATGQPGPTDRLEVTIFLRRKKKLDLEASYKGVFLSREELEESYGASDTDLDLVRDFAEHFGLDTVRVDKGMRVIVLSGPVLAFEQAFRTKLVHVLSDGHIYRSRSGALMVPSELEGAIGVFGLDNRLVAQPHFKRGSSPTIGGAMPDAFDGNRLAAIYDFPKATGEGAVIALIELGGGVSTADIKSYFQALGLPQPTVKVQLVAGGNNRPGQDEDADTEVALDVEVAGSAAPQSTIVVYFAPNTSDGFLQAILAAVHDTENKPTIMSISWGSSESTWTGQLMTAMDDAFQSACALGISVFVAAGDDGANDNVSDGLAHTDFPGTSPSVTACGGTTLVLQNNVRQEFVWNDGDGSATGGGISDVFQPPAYQQDLAMPVSLNSGKAGRGVPDVAALADPDVGYAVFVDGSRTIVGGTSAVAPLYAGLTARINQLLGKPSGLINPVLYQAGIKCGFYDISRGNNSCDGVSGYSAGPGWDAVSGWGTPGGLALMNLLSTRGGGSQSGGTRS